MITAVLVDDEEKSIRNIELLLEQSCPDVQVVGRAANALEAVQLVLNHRPGIVFLDVHMPGYSGFDVLENIRGAGTLVIFTTAHKNYAISALRKGAFDYLLKPIDTDELTSCVERARLELFKTAPSGRGQSSAQGMIELSVKDGIIFIRTADLIRLEASGSYTIFYLENNVKHMASKTLKEYEALLDSAVFFRCHNSHIINLRKVTRYIHTNGYFAELSNGSTIEIARKNKEIFLERLKNLEV
jgi:two-component system, LytTR family, response regulator